MTWESKDGCVGAEGCAAAWLACLMHSMHSMLVLLRCLARHHQHASRCSESGYCSLHSPYLPQTGHIMPRFNTEVLICTLCSGAGLLLLCLHQLVLSSGGIEAVHSDIRGPDLLSANKEGLLSLPGYCALRLLSLCMSSIMKTCCTRSAQNPR